MMQTDSAGIQDPPDLPVATARRLAAYDRVLADLESEGAMSVSSRELGQRTGVSPAAVRDDLSRFGHFGKGGPGYDIGHLRVRLGEALRDARGRTPSVVAPVPTRSRT